MSSIQAQPAAKSYVINDQFLAKGKGENKKVQWNKKRLHEIATSCGKDTIISFQNPKKITAQLALSLFRKLENENADSTEFMFIDITPLMGPKKSETLKAKFKDHL